MYRRIKPLEGVGRGARKRLSPTGPPPPIPPRSPVRAKSPDPRGFLFAIVCKRCEVMRASLRVHLGECPAGREIDLLCGHCEFRTTSWPAMCAHLNRSGIQKEAACRPEYRISAPSLPLFSAPLPSLTPTTRRDISAKFRRFGVVLR